MFQPEMTTMWDRCPDDLSTPNDWHEEGPAGVKWVLDRTRHQEAQPCCTPDWTYRASGLMCVLDEAGRTVEMTAVRPDADALATLSRHLARHGQPISAAIESMTGARFVHDQLELAGWDVEIADAQKVKCLVPLAAPGPGRRRSSCR
jgi:hypothetical protein